MELTELNEDFICRILSDEATDEEIAIFRLMLAEDEELKKEYKHIEQTWYYGKYTKKWEQLDEDKAWRHIKAAQTRRIRQRKLLYWKIAVVILLFLGCGMLLLLDNNTHSLPQLAEEVQTVQPRQSKALLVLSTGEKVELGTTGQKTISDGGISVENDSAVLVYQPSISPKEQLFNELIVPIGGEYRLCLSDGTVVYLNSDSRLRYPVHFGKEKREVELEGEAYFEVVSDKKHPFYVNTKNLEVKVLGTGFNVAVYTEEDRSEVTLTHGIVVVEESDKEFVLKPDEKLVLNKRTGQVQIQQINAQKVCAWKDGALYFEGMPLEELSVKLSRWFDVHFFFTDENLKRLKFSGAFKKHNRIEYVLSLIEATTDIRVQVKGNTIMVDHKR